MEASLETLRLADVNPTLTCNPQNDQVQLRCTPGRTTERHRRHQLALCYRKFHDTPTINAASESRGFMGSRFVRAAMHIGFLPCRSLRCILGRAFPFGRVSGARA